MKKNITSIIHQPKKIILISLVFALALGFLGYHYIHKIPADQYIQNDHAQVPQNISLGFASSGKVKTVLVANGEHVVKGQVLTTLYTDNTDGSLIQAQAAYDLAKANYQKIIHGATGTTVDIAKAAVNTAQVNLDQVKKSQDVLVNNAHQALMNSSLTAQSTGVDTASDAPTVSGTYECANEGTYDLKLYSSSGGYSITYSGLEAGTAFLTDVPRPLGTCGLSLSFDKNKTPSSGSEFTIQIPNKNASNYSTNKNAYDLAIQTKGAATASAQAALDQANASLEQVASNARPEDVAVAKAQVDSAYGALIANPTYNNTTILAPSDGTVTAVHITPNKVVVANDLAIEFLGLSN